MREKPTAYDYMVGVSVVLQDMRRRTNELKSYAEKMNKNLEGLKDAKNLNASNLVQQFANLVSDYNLANLHIGFAEKRVASLLERLKRG